MDNQTLTLTVAFKIFTSDAVLKGFTKIGGDAVLLLVLLVVKLFCDGVGSCLTILLIEKHT